MTEISKALKNMEKKYKTIGGIMVKKTAKKVSKKARKTREVFTRKKALELLNLVQAEVEKGDMGVTAACRKYNFPMHKYSYWKNVKEESDKLDAAIEEYEKENPEVLHDSSQLAIKERVETIEKLNRDVSDLWEKIQTLQVENTKLKDAILKKEGIL